MIGGKSRKQLCITLLQLCFTEKKCRSKRLEGYITRKLTDFVRVLDFFSFNFSIMWSSYFYDEKDQRVKKEICQGPGCLKRGFLKVLGPDKLMSAEQMLIFSSTKQVTASFTSLSVMILACWKIRSQLKKLFVLLSPPLGQGTPVIEQKGIW